jgi:hypothetical protein
MKRVLLSLGRIGVRGLGVAILAARAPAGAQSLRVVSDILVDATPPGRAVEEPHLAIDPKNPNHLLAAAIVGAAPGAKIDEQHCATFSSTDGGAHWARHDFPIIECYDPWVAFLPDGGALLSTLGKDRLLAGDGDGMLVYRSPDGGVTWGARPAGLSWGWDHPMLVVDNSAPQRGEWVYLVSSRDQKKNGGYVVAISRSLDGGKSFDLPRIIAAHGDVVKAETPAILSDGTLVVPYVEIIDAGVLLPARKAFAVRSHNGIDFSKPSAIGEVCGPPPDYSQSWMVVDASKGIFRDRLYFACALPGRRGVAVSHSADHGLTWSAARSAAGDPRDPSSPRALMAAAVTSTGVLGIVWLEHRGGSPAGCSDVYMSASFDGGDRFTRPLRVSHASSCPNGKLNGGVSYGDYFGLAGDSRGQFHLVWPDARRTGLLELHSALIEVAGPVGRGR